MCRSSFKYNLTFIILFFGITLVHADPEEQKTSDNTKKILLYYADWSVPCRAVLMLGKMLNVQFELKELDLTEKREQYNPKFLAINPLHKVPVIEDDGYVITESHAILVYMAQKFISEKKLFPQTVKEQAVVNEMLQFNMGTLSKAFNTLFGLWVLFGSPKTEFKHARLLTALQGFDDILRKRDKGYAAGVSITVADVALFANIISIKASEMIQFTKYTHIENWYKKCQDEITMYAEVNEKGLKIIKNSKEKREQTESKGEVAVLVSNSDVHKAVQTLLNAVQTQVIATEHSKYLKPLLEFLTPLVKA